MNQLNPKYFIFIFLIVSSQCALLLQIRAEFFNISNKINIQYVSNDSSYNSESWVQPLPVGDQIILDSNNSIYIVGSDRHYSSSSNVTVMRYSNSREELWVKTWGGVDMEYCYDSNIDSADNIYLTGETRSYGVGSHDLFLLKYNSSGFQEWMTTWGFGDDDAGYSIVIDSNDFIYVSGVSTNRNFCLLKYDTSGILQWVEILSQLEVLKIKSVEIDTTNSIYIYLNTLLGEIDGFLLKYNSSGELIWSKQYGADYTEYTECLTMHIDSDDNILVSGRTYFAENETLSSWVIKYNGSGFTQWKYSWYDRLIYEIIFDAFDNIYVKADVSYRDSYLIKYNNKFEQIFDIKLEFYMFMPIIKVDLLQNIYVISDVEIPNEDFHSDVYIAKYNIFGGFQSSLTWGTSKRDYVCDFVIDIRNDLYLLCGRISTKAFLVKNPIDNNKSLKLSPWKNPLVIYFIILISISCIIALITLYSILMPRLKEKKENSTKILI